jgi:hypothetical protein
MGALTLNSPGSQNTIAISFGVEGTDEITTIRRTTLRRFGMVVTSSVPSMSGLPLA